MTGFTETLNAHLQYQSPVPIEDQSAFSRVNVPIYAVDISQSKLVWANASGLSFLGLTVQECIDANNNFMVDLPAPFNNPSYRNQLRSYLNRIREEGSITECITVVPNANSISVYCTFSPQALTSGAPGLLVQVTSEVGNEPAQVRSAQVLLHTTSMITMFDESGKLLFENPASRFNRPSGCEDLANRICNRRDFDALMAELRINGEASLVALMHSNQGERWFDLNARSAFDPVSGARAISLNATDVTKRLQAEHEVRYLAHHDTLTGLPNRTFLEIEAERYLDETRLSGNPGALIFIDLDRFKSINDTLGHLVGDDLLVVIAKRLKEVVEGIGFVARLGGDEFVVLIANFAETDLLSEICREIRTALSQPCKVRGHMLQVTPSVGVCTYPEHGVDLDTLMRKADLAMYKAKDLGRDRICFFDVSMSREAEERVSLETALRQAIRGNELAVHYQPRVDVVTNQVIGAEALLRWHHPTRGIVSAASFIEIAEEAGMIDEIGDWVARDVMLQQNQWAQAGHDVAISINLSPAQFRRGRISQRLRSILEETGASASSIRLEITESALLSDANETLKELNALRELGFTLEIDDFGTGYSNLGYLQRYPVTALKIDRSFIADTKRWPIVQMIVQMGRLLNLTLVAEGIETKDQLRQIQKLQCHEYQGYLFSPAVPPLTFERLLKGQHFIMPPPSQLGASL
ncbi:Cyclic di-GMP phosphodiesterase Gmr [Pseudovibrio axinellae]|uniref:Cyclic di-GMP phosphodiesterase Gmr n=1 Tax=Pseudovibrio axinellae TaxID=989403 RepID=A0A165TWW6_9HYPH|nr:EAL domain-containing protein [Pseudovibrio axinellae]KZL06743.1 Cyclic di-GMP phosphodiesterase Gmr [Pseudovibrio axinellae]SER62632.1 diguanylate cyclase/phosphodiesterase [Pseudovibrio axinellae]